MFATGSMTVAGKKIEAVALAMDFSKVDDVAQWNAFQSAIENKDIGVLGAYDDLAISRYLMSNLVNNVGRSQSFPADFVDAPVEEVDSILSININSVVKVTRAVLPGMIQRCAKLRIVKASIIDSCE